MSYHQMHDRDIMDMFVVDNKLHLEYIAPTEETIFTIEDLLFLLSVLQGESE